MQASTAAPGRWRSRALALVGGSLLVLGVPGVLATLNAQTSNPSPEAVSSGTLKLTVSATNPSAGFSSEVANLAPGDVVNRYVDLTSGGSLDAQGLTLGIAATGTSSLITDGAAPATTKALRVTVSSCPVAWTQATGLCAGGSGTVEVASAPLSSWSVAKAFATSSMSAGSVAHLQVQVVLPDQAETTVDGVPPVTTVQGGTANLTYTFTELQRSSRVTNG